MELLNILGPHPPLRRPAGYRETHLSLLSHWESKDNLRHEDDISAQIKDHFQISRFVQSIAPQLTKPKRLDTLLLRKATIYIISLPRCF